MGQAQQTECVEEVDIKAIQDMYKKFVTECPSGRLFLHEFKRFFGVEPEGEASQYAENMFRAFDKNGVRGGTRGRRGSATDGNVTAFFIFALVVPLGQHHRFPGVRGVAKPGLPRGPGAQTAMVLQGVRPRQQRLRGQERAALHHSGEFWGWR